MHLRVKGLSDSIDTLTPGRVLDCEERVLLKAEKGVRNS
jgi:hypothetical protein